MNHMNHVMNSLHFKSEGLITTHYEVCEVVVLVTVTVLFFFPIDWQSVVVVLRVSHL